MDHATACSRLGRRRLYPPFWDHHRAILAPLRQEVIRLRDTKLGVQPGHVVVDLGCGDRPYEPLFTATGCRYLGCDLGSAAEIPIVPGEPLALADESADGLVSFQVLEHVWDLDWYLGEAHRLLKPGGWLLLSTHGTWLYHPHPTDFRRWTRDGLVRELKERGFEVAEVTPILGPLAWTTLFRALGFREALRRVPVIGGVLSALVVGLMNMRIAIEDAITPRRIIETNASIYLLLCHRTSGNGWRNELRPDRGDKGGNDIAGRT